MRGLHERFGLGYTAIARLRGLARDDTERAAVERLYAFDGSARDLRLATTMLYRAGFDEDARAASHYIPPGE